MFFRGKKSNRKSTRTRSRSSARSRSNDRRRRLRLESLESRQLLAADVFLGTNATSGVDVNPVGMTTTYTPNAAFAEINVVDIETQLNMGRTVIVTNTFAGPPNPGMIGIFANITKSMGTEAELRFISEGSIEFSGAMIESTTGQLDVSANSDSTGSGSGPISLDGSTITTFGGDVFFSGGVDPLVGAAVGGVSNTIGVSINGSIITDGGNVSIRGTGATGGGEGVIISSNIDAASGMVAITGTATTGVGTGVGVTLEGASVNIDGGSINITGTGAGIATSHQGVSIQNTTTIQDAGTGSISITGVAGTGGSNNQGIDVFDIGTTIRSSGGTVMLDGTGGGSVDSNHGVIVRAGASVSNTASGSVTILGQSGSGANNNNGVQISDINTEVTTVDGAITLDGSGVGTGGVNHGVSVVNQAQVRATGTGAVSVTGNNTGGTQQNYGVLISEAGSVVQSTGGGVTVVGTSAGTDSDNAGVFVNEGIIEDTAAGNVSITGTGGTGTNDNIGVRLIGSASAIRSTGGTITVDGTGRGTGILNQGVFLQGGASISNTLTGSVNVIGQSGPGTDQNIGVDIAGLNTQVSTVDGAITIDGTGVGSGVGNYGVAFTFQGQVRATGTGAVSLTGNNTGGTQFNHGVFIDQVGPSVESTGGGVTVVGTSAGTDTDNAGVFVNEGIIEDTAAGNVSITGTGGTGTNDNIGVRLIGSPSAIRSTGGTVSVDGTGRGTGILNQGVFLQGGASISNTLTGSVNVIGQSGPGTVQNQGVFLDGTLTQITSVDGAITINGTAGGTGNANEGFLLSNQAMVSATGAGSIDITGTNTGGTDLNHAVLVTLDSALTSNGGGITLNGTSNATGVDNVGVRVSLAEVRDIATGNVTITGTGGIGTDRNSGIQVEGSTGAVQSNGGSLTLNGTGRGTGIQNRGVRLADSAQIGTAGTGVIDVTGLSGDGTMENVGISVDSNASVSSADGNITFNGTGRGSTTGNNGVEIASSINLTGTGLVSITGINAGGISDNVGVLVGSTSGQVSAFGGGVTVVGTSAGTTFGNRGVSLDGGGISDLSITGGPINITGTSGDGSGVDNEGIDIRGSVNTTGAITLTGTGRGTGDSSEGVSITATGGVSSSDGAIGLIGDSTATGADNAGVIINGNGTFVESITSALTITGVGGGTSGIGVEVSGDADVVSGGVSVTGTSSIPDTDAIRLLNSTNLLDATGGDANLTAISGPLTTSGGPIVAAPTTITGVFSPGGTTTTQQFIDGGLILDGSSSLAVQINGLVPGIEHDQLVVRGAVDLGGSDLDLSGSIGNDLGQVITLIDNDGPDAVVGTFAGLPEATSFIMNRLIFQISYAGGDGSNDVTLTQIDTLTTPGTAANDALVLSTDGIDVTLIQNGLPLAVLDPAAVNRFVIGGDIGNDTLTIDYTGGNPIPLSGVSFDGGPAGFDALEVVGGNASLLRHTFLNASDGNIDIDGSLIEYVGLEPIIDNMSVDNRIFDFQGGTETIALGVDANFAGNNLIDSTLGESVLFTNPTNSLTILSGTGDDTINITALDPGFAASLIIDGGDGANDTLSLDGVVLDTGNNGRGLTLRELETIDVNAGAITNNTSPLGGGVNIANSTSGTTTTATFDSVTISNNTASDALLSGSRGGGIFADGVNLIVEDSTSISGNFAGGDGGGIFQLGGSLTVTASTIGSNDAGESGGGVYVDGGALTMNSAVVTGNTAQGADSGGGGVYLLGTGATSPAFTVNNTDFTSNTASSGGGGLEIVDNPGTITDGLYELNRVVTGALNAEGGGAIVVLAGDSTTSPPISISGVTLRNNSAPAGGGLAAVNPNLTLESVLIENNTTIDFGAGAGIALQGDSGGGTVTILNSSIQTNTSDGDGGGIAAVDVDLFLMDTTVSSNRAGDSSLAVPIAGRAGGIGLIGSSRTPVLTANRVTVDNNTSADEGGGIALLNAGLNFTNVTVTDNESTAAAGGGLFYDNTDAIVTRRIEFSTFASNVDPSFNSNIDAQGAPIDMLATLFADGIGVFRGGFTFNSLGFNVNNSTPPGLIDPTDIISTDVSLLTLGDFGGPVSTRPSEDAVSLNLVPVGQSIAVDARGVPRTGTTSDLGDAGAVESFGIEVGVVSAVESGGAQITSVALDRQVPFAVTLSNTGINSNSVTAAAQNLLFPVSQSTTPLSYSFSLVDDTDVELNASQTIGFTSDVGPVVGSFALANIDDDDTNVFDVVGMDVSEDGLTATITVTSGNRVANSLGADQPYLVDFTTNPGTATADVDYTTTTDFLSFDGTAAQTLAFTVPILEDSLLEVIESFSASLLAVVSADAEPIRLAGFDLTDTSSVSILDNDAIIADADLAAIAGTVFLDSDADNTQGPAESALANVQVTLYTDNNADGTIGSFDAADVSVAVVDVIAGSGGAYRFSNLDGADFDGLTDTGLYFLEITPLPGGVTDDAGTALPGVILPGVQSVTISGTDDDGVLVQSIDDFSQSQAGSSSDLVAPGSVDLSSGNLTSVLGGERDVRHEYVSGTSFSHLFVVGDGELLLENSPGVVSSFLLQYDGPDADDGALQLAATGLGGIDVTGGDSGGGFFLNLNSRQAASDSIRIRVYSNEVSFSDATIGITGIPERVFVPLSSFSGSADFTNVGAIELSLELAAVPTEALELTVSGFETRANTVIAADSPALSPLGIGGRIFVDNAGGVPANLANQNNGVRDTGENDLPDPGVGLRVELQLFELADPLAGFQGPGIDILVNTIMTDPILGSDGAYRFIEDSVGNPLSAGAYVVVIEDSQFLSGSPLEGFVVSSTQSADVDLADQNDAVLVTNVGLVSSVIELAPGSEPDVAVDGTDTNTNSTVDFGVLPTNDLLVDTALDLVTSSLLPGGTAVLDLLLENLGPTDATNITVDQFVPVGMTLSQIDLSGTPVTTTASTEVGGLMREIQTFTVTSLPAGSSLAYRVVFDIDTDIAADTVSEVQVDGFEVEVDNDPNNPVGSDPTLNNSASAPIDVALATLAITKTDNLQTVTAGGTLTYQISVANTSTDTAFSVVALDPLPSGVTFTSANFISGIGTISLITDPNDPNVGSYQIDFGDLAASESEIVEILVSVDPTIADSLSPLTNTVTVSALNAPTDSATDQTDVIREVDLFLSKALDSIRTPDDRTDNDTSDDLVDLQPPFEPVAGGFATFEIFVDNIGPSQARGVTVTDTLAAGMTFVAGSLDDGGAGITVSQLGQELTFTLPDGSLNGALSFLYEVGIPANRVLSFANSATVASTDTDTDPDNDTASVTIIPVQRVDMVLTTDVDNATAVPGGAALTYTFTVSHDVDSVSDSQSLNVLSVLPTGLTSVQFSAPGSVASFFDPNTLELFVDYDNVAVETPRVFTVTANIDPSATGTLTSTSSISPSLTNDLDTANDTSTSTVTLFPAYDVQIEKTLLTTGPIEPNDAVTFEIVVSHDVLDDGLESDNGQSPSTATGIVVADTLPGGLTFVSISSGGVPVTPTFQSGGVIQLPAFDLLPTESRTYTLTASVDDTATGSLVNTSSLSASDDTQVDNNSDTATVVLAGLADLAVTKTADQSSIVVGGDLTYTIDVTNNGPSTALDVLAIDSLPAGVTFLSGTGPDGPLSATGSSVNGQTVEVSLASLPAAGSMTFTFTVRLDDQLLATSISNSVIVSTTTSESELTNNSDSVVTTVMQPQTRVTGHAFCDSNGNGTEDIRDATVFVDTNRNGRLDPGENFTTTDTDGAYSLTMLDPGNSQIVLILPDDCSSLPNNFAVAPLPTDLGEIVREIKIVDLDGDGIDDLLAVSDRSDSLVRLRQTSQGIQEERILLTDRPQALDVWVNPADSTDVHTAVASVGGGSIVGSNGLLRPNFGSIFTVNGDSPIALPFMGDGPIDVVVDDFNGDGIPDYVSAAFRSNDFAILLSGQSSSGSPSSGLSSAASVLGTGDAPISVESGDFDGDGDQDLVLGSRGYGERTSTVRLLFNDGSGSFTDGPVFTTQDKLSTLAVADLTPGDLRGRDELITLTEAGILRAFAIENGSLSSLDTVQLDPATSKIRVGDINEDQLPDIAVMRPGSGQIDLLLGDGSGGLSLTRVADASSNAVDIAFGDLDDSGQPGLIIADLVPGGTAGGSTNLVKLRADAAQADVVAGGIVQIDFSPSALLQRMDVNANGTISTVDALTVINALNATESGNAASEPLAGIAILSALSANDVNGDGEVTPLDALRIINHLNNPDQDRLAYAGEPVSGSIDGTSAGSSVEANADDEVRSRQASVDEIMGEVGSLF